MSDPRLNDPLNQASADRRYAPPSDRPSDDRTSSGSMWGVIALVAVLIVGGLIYFANRSDVASRSTSTNTGAAPQSDQRPAPPVPPAPPTQQPK